MDYLVKLSNNFLIEICLDSETALGENLLSEVCKRVGTVEEDFFGLQYGNRHGSEKYWINLRNKLKPQLHSTFRVDLKVKFFVEPHFIVQDSTRLLVFNSFKHDFHEGNFRCPTDDLTRLTAHIAHATIGNASRFSKCQLHACYHEIIPTSVNATEDFLNHIETEHKHMSGLKQSKAVYETLKIASACENYGEEYHHVRVEGTSFVFGVGPKGIVLYDKNMQRHQMISFQMVLKATHKGRDFYLQTVGENRNTEKRLFKLQNTDSSKALYRCVTEMYLFYVCDTVRNDVSSQFCRDLKGTLASFFNENTELGKNFVFDIKRTLKEANDHARRELYRMNSAEVTSTIRPECYSWLMPGSIAMVPDSKQRQQNRMETSEGDVFTTDRPVGGAVGGFGWKSGRRHSWCSSDSVQRVAPSPGECSEDEPLLCQVCVSRDLNTVFCPCGHATCCDACAAQLNTCPICRGSVTHRQTLYLPNRTRHVSR